MTDINTAFAQIRTRIQAASVEAVKAAQEVIVRNAQELVHVDEGNLLRSIQARPPYRYGSNVYGQVTAGDESTITDWNGVGEEIFEELGTGSHPIRPKNKKAMYWKGADHPVKGTIIHPGTQATHFMEHALLNASQEVPEVVGIRFRQYLRSGS